MANCSVEVNITSLCYTHSVTTTVEFGYDDVLIIAACCLLIICALVGNLLVIVAVATNRRLRSVTNCFVVSLAAADALVAVLVMPMATAEEVTNTWVFGRFMCDVYTSMDVMMCTASILNLCCISVDRYLAITRPLMYVTKRTKKLALIMVTVAWLLSAVIILPAVVGWKDKEYGLDDTVCYIPRAPGFVVYSACGSFFIPMVIMLYMYYRIFRVANNREKYLTSYTRHLSGKYGSNSGNEDASLSDISASNKNLNEDKGSGSRGITMEKSKFSFYRFQPKRLCEVYLLRAVSAKCSTKCESIPLGKDSVELNICAQSPKSCRTGESSLTVRNMHVQHSTSCPGSFNRPISQRSGNLISLERDVPWKESPQNTNPSQSVEDDRDTEKTKAKEQAIFKKEHKAAKTLAIVVGAFTVCWMPFFALYVVKPFCQCDIPHAWLRFTVWLGYLNSAVNPLIYAFHSAEFRHTFWSLTCALICKLCSSNAPESSQPTVVGTIERKMVLQTAESSKLHKKGEAQYGSRQLSSGGNALVIPNLV